MLEVHDALVGSFIRNWNWCNEVLDGMICVDILVPIELSKHIGNTSSYRVNDAELLEWSFRVFGR